MGYQKNGNWKRDGRKNYDTGYTRDQYAPQQQKVKAKNGSKLTNARAKDGSSYPCIVAWMVDKNNGVIVNMIASKKKKSDSKGKAQQQTYTTKSGLTGEIWTCKINWGQGRETLHTGFFNPQTSKLRIPDCNLVASPKAQRRETIGQGYFGKSIFTN